MHSLNDTEEGNCSDTREADRGWVGRQWRRLHPYAGLLLTPPRPLSGEHVPACCRGKHMAWAQGRSGRVLPGALAGGLEWVGELFILTLKEGS